MSEHRLEVFDQHRVLPAGRGTEIASKPPHGVSHNPFASRRLMAVASMSLGDGRHPALHRRNLEPKLLRTMPKIEGEIVGANRKRTAISVLAPVDKVLPVRQIGALRVGHVGLSGELERLEYLGVHEVASASWDRRLFIGSPFLLHDLIRLSLGLVSHFHVYFCLVESPNFR